MDANVSVRYKNEMERGVRTEIKNISGLRFLAKAIGTVAVVSKIVSVLLCSSARL